MTDDSHHINRDRRGPDPDPDETFTCEYCGEEYDDRVKYERHMDREKRNQFRGNPIGEAILEADRAIRTKYR